MKAITTKPTQMRLDTYVFALHKWAKIQENYHKTLADPSKPVVLQTTPQGNRLNVIA